MKVSVIIPAFNEEKYIGACLRSLKKQIIPPDEIIVVDNNSTDSTVELVKKFSNVRIIREKKQGLIPARNRGFNDAIGDTLARCDADCLLPFDWIRRIKEDFAANPDIEGLVGTAIFYDFPFKNIEPIISKSIEQMKKTLGHYPFFGSNMVIKKASWERIKKSACKDAKLVHEDLDLSIHLHEAGGKIMFDDQLVAKISARRLKKNPHQILIEYPYRMQKTIRHHHISLKFT